MITSDLVTSECNWGMNPKSITKTRLFKYIENFTTKNSDKNSDSFNISA